MLGEGERTQRTRMRQSRDYSGRVGLGDAKLGGVGEARRETGGGAAQLSSRFVKQHEEVARRPTGRPARHVAKGVGPGLSRNPKRFAYGYARTRGRV